MSEKYTESELKDKFPDVFARMREICIGRSCVGCPLFDCCPYGFTVEKVEDAYNSLFGKNIEIKETDILDLFGG